DVWSRERGHKQAALIMERLHTLLHDTQPSMEDGVVVSLRYSGSQIALEEDGATYHGVFRLKALLHE
ncbi:MAG: DUF3168 domain-containing protein, partial [Rickettsiales bacterium]|nr:DUF3168 domain-containing protein [Rickettsiales bacterium]